MLGEMKNIIYVLFIYITTTATKKKPLVQILLEISYMPEQHCIQNAPTAQNCDT